MEHFSKQVIDSRQVFIGFPQGKPNMFSLVSVGFEKCLPEFLVERVSYPETGRSNSEIEFTTIEFIISGNGELCLGGSNFNLEPGSLFSYKTGEYHKISSSQNKPMVKYFMVLAHSPEIIIKSKIINQIERNLSTYHIPKEIYSFLNLQLSLSKGLPIFLSFSVS